jgi:enoyl-CoA hydratase/carnithine racemase
MSDLPHMTLSERYMSTIDQALILTERQDAVLTLTINRPARKNALTLSMYEQLTDALRLAAENSKVRAVVITGAGDAFTAGNDLKDFMQSPPTSADTPVFHFIKEIFTFPKPLIAAVNGAAIGIGTTMLLHCDLAYASEDAIFQLSFIRLGLVPEAGVSYLLPRIVGHRRAAELLMLGEKFDAPTALEIGLINEYVSSGEALKRAQARAHELALLPPEAMRQTKQLLRQPLQSTLEEVMLQEGEVFMNRLTSPETAEAIQAFFMKRLPDFSRFS